MCSVVIGMTSSFVGTCVSEICAEVRHLLDRARRKVSEVSRKHVHALVAGLVATMLSFQVVPFAWCLFICSAAQRIDSTILI